MSAQSALVPAGSRALGLGFTGNLGNIDAYISAVNRIPVLTVEGTITSQSSNAVEVPRIRFAVRNATGQEIYAWTSKPSRMA